MITYQMAEIVDGMGSRVYLNCTHVREAERILASVDKELSCQVTRDSTPSGTDRGEWEIRGNLANQHQIVWSIARELCDRGWEPFAVTRERQNDIRRHFRRALRAR